jgi:hypothetical protein
MFDLGRATLPGCCLRSADNPEAVYGTLEEAGVTRLYPGFEAWFSGKVIPGMRTGERQILTSAVGGKLAGVAICKRSDIESKLCTLWVAPEARGRGIAADLAGGAFAWLGTIKPLFTVPAERLAEFQGLLRAWSFSDHVACSGMYRPQRVEHVFNGNAH